MPRESCYVTGTAYVIASNGNVAWKQFKADKLPFDIHHQDRKKDKHDHFLKVYLDFHLIFCNYSLITGMWEACGLMHG